MLISVLICTYNRSELLKTALKSLLNFNSIELVVVNGGDDTADKVVEDFQRSVSYPVKLIKTRNINLATSRNIGLKACSGDIIAMTDDDAEVFPDWIENIERLHLAHPEAGAIGGMVIGTHQEKLINRIADAVTFPIWESERPVRTLPGVNISYKRRVLDLIGEQDATLFRGEDVDFNWRVIKAGYSVLFSPELRVFHHHRPSLKGLMQQHYMYGKAYVFVRSKWPEMYCAYPHDIKDMKNLLKAMYFISGFLIQPFISASKLSRWFDKLISLPVLFLINGAWRVGVFTQLAVKFMR